MVNYQNGKIYKLVNNSDDEIYVGSTCNPLYKRKGGHKRKAKIQPNREVYKHLNEVGWENVEIILIENFSCNSKDELHRRERYWIDTLNPSLNKVIPTRTLSEWIEENKEVISQKQKEFRESNKEVISQKAKEYRELNKEELSQKRKEYYHNNKEAILQQQQQKYRENKKVILQKAKEWREKNKEAISQRDKEWREKNKEVISQKEKIKDTCECGKTLTKTKIPRHKKTKKRLFW